MQNGAIRVRVEVTGDDAVRRQLQAMGPRGPQIVKAVFDQATERMVPKGQARAPLGQEDIDPGALRRSLRRTTARVTAAGRVSAGFIAGGAPLAGVTAATGHSLNIYASIQEEDLTLAHDEGQGKFMGQTFVEEVQRIPDDIQAGIDAGFAATGG